MCIAVSDPELLNAVYKEISEKLGMDNGNPVWKTNLSADVYTVHGIQVVENRIILQLYLEDGTHYVVLDPATGAVLQDAVSLT